MMPLLSRPHASLPSSPPGGTQVTEAGQPSDVPARLAMKPVATGLFVAVMTIGIVFVASLSA
jgi:hypothetical protein